MKKVSIFAATISLAMLLNGCQNADDSNASDEDQGKKNEVAVNDGDAGSPSDKGNEGSSSGSESGNSGSAQGADGGGYANYGAANYAKSGDDPSKSGQAGYANYGAANYAKKGNDPSKSGQAGYANYGAANYAKKGSGPPGSEAANYGSSGPGSNGANYGSSGSGRPGANGGYGAGSGGQRPGSGGAPQNKEGTAEHAVFKTCTAISNGEQKGLAEFISSRAKGDLAELRNGKLATEKFDELKQQMARVKFLSPRTSGSSKIISIQNEEGRIFRFTCRKEDGKYLIREFQNKAPSKKKRRGR